ncbi:hypothetical protein EVG20_g11598, partial [Dentipellis fragilis]
STPPLLPAVSPPPPADPPLPIDLTADNDNVASQPVEVPGCGMASQKSETGPGKRYPRSKGMKESKRLRRQKARAAKAALTGPRDCKMWSSISRAYSQPLAIEVKFSVSMLTAVKLTYVGLSDPRKDHGVWTLEDYLSGRLGQRFKLMEWDGNEPRVLCTTEGHQIGIMPSMPKDKDWLSTVESVASLMEKVRLEGAGRWKGKQLVGRRGDFVAVNVGTAYGLGHKFPANLKNRGREGLVNKLLADPGVQQIAGFGSSVLKTYAPKIFKHYADSLDTLYASGGPCTSVFRNSVFPTAAFNLGPRCVCRGHKDNTNVPHGLCAITAMGTFNYKKGGHLVLWDLGLIIEFPPGATILIPSSTLHHGNTAIGKDERRYSFTQYCMGGLLRWVRYGLRPANSLSRKERELIDGDITHTSREAMAMFSKVTELQKDRDAYLTA